MPEATPPTEIELTELDTMKLIATSATMGKLHAELQVIELQVGRLMNSSEERVAKVAKLAEEYKKIQAEIAVRNGVENLDAYDIDLAGRKCRLRPPPAGG